MLDVINTNSQSEIIRYTSVTKPFQDKLKQIGEGTVVFNNITKSAQPYICSVISDYLSKDSNQRLWILTDDLNTQELITEGMGMWFNEPLFFPDIESVSSNNSLPDQECFAERISVLKTLNDSELQNHIVVLLEKSLEETVTSPKSINSNKIEIKLEQNIEMDYLVNQLEKINYEKI